MEKQNKIINFSNDENILPYFNTSSFILKEPYRIQVYKNDDYIKKVKLNFDYVSDIDLPKQIEELKDYLLKAKKLNKNEYDINDDILDIMEQLRIIDENIYEFYKDVLTGLNKYAFIKKEKEYVDNIDEFKEYLKEEINYIINCEMELEV